VSAWVARAGARPVGIDNSEQQLAAARAMQDEFNIHFPLLHGNAEEVPYPDATFDLAISEHGAACTARKLGSGYAACEYSLISPLRIFLRRTRSEARSTTAGPVSLASGGR
jgi:hypothetical protein